MPSMIQPDRPNLNTLIETIDETIWGVIATDGTSYATIALLLAAGKTEWPGPPFGGVTGTVVSLRSRTTAMLAGSAFQYAYNRSDANFGSLANDAARNAVAASKTGGADESLEEGGVYNVWRRRTVATDELELVLRG